MIRIFALLLTLALSTGCFAQNTKRQNLKLIPQNDTVAVRVDTTRAAARMLSIAGYEKAQNVSVESMFITNNGTDTINGINITITYFDLKGRQLHSRTESLNCTIPPEETRNVNIKSWDRQRMWYYRLSQAKHSKSSTPYDIKIRINYVILPPEHTDN